MNNDLEKLTHELEKIGLNKERLLHDESSEDRYHPWITQTSHDICCFMMALKKFHLRTNSEIRAFRISFIGEVCEHIQGIWCTV